MEIKIARAKETKKLKFEVEIATRLKKINNSGCLMNRLARADIEATRFNQC